MARKEALLRLHRRLTERRDALRKELARGRESARDRIRGGDVGDAAFDDACGELDSQMASLEARELRQIERALEQMRQGQYGICDLCTKPIPVARLNAIPYATFCVPCQSRLEEERGPGEAVEADWEAASDFEGRYSERDVSIKDLRIDD